MPFFMKENAEFLKNSQILAKTDDSSNSMALFYLQCKAKETLPRFFNNIIIL